MFVSFVGGACVRNLVADGAFMAPARQAEELVELDRSLLLAGCLEGGSRSGEVALYCPGDEVVR